jgi:hypothetical protein
MHFWPGKSSLGRLKGTVGEHAPGILQKWLHGILLDIFSKLSDLRCGGSLVARGITFFDVPLITRETVKGVQVGQRTKLGRFAKQLHRPHAVMAARSFGRGRISVAHDTISSRCAGMWCASITAVWLGAQFLAMLLALAIVRTTKARYLSPPQSSVVGRLWVLPIHLHYSRAQIAKHFISALKLTLDLRPPTPRRNARSALVPLLGGKGSLF